MSIKISSDSTCDLSKELIESNDIGIIPLYIILGSETYRDGVDVSVQDVFNYITTTKQLPHTAALAEEEYAEKFEEYLKEYDEVIHFNISSKASVTHEGAKKAAQRFGGKVQVIDSLHLSTGQGLLVLKACDLLKEGKSSAQIVEEINALRAKVNTSFIPDSLDNLHKGGRCSLAALMGAKVLKLHPMIDMKDGKLYAKKKYMGSIDRCLKKYVEELAVDHPNYDKTRCFITHSHCSPETVAKVKEVIENHFHFDEIIETFAGCTVSVHCGQGTLGVLFIYD
ncbi:MAG: DegV family protein [Clostridiales bacterium]|nr:DegV family protein [Clostridiales bacterium]